jgi:8-oxo-(d)GTP phosphatase
MAADPVTAAGAVVLRGEGSDVQVALVHRPKYDDWSFPKGKPEGREHVVTTAVREVAEETSLAVRLCRPLSSREYLVDGRPKIVHYWVARTVGPQPRFRANAEVDRLEWVTPTEAERRLTQPRDAELVELALHHPPGTAFAVVRHAKARKRSTWKGDDEARPLTATGRRDAKSLVPLLAAYGVAQLHSSPAVRCRLTLQPFARTTGQPLVEASSLSEQGFDADPGGGLAHVHGLMQRAAAEDSPTAVCTHRPVIPAVVGHLLEGSGLAGPTETVPTASLVLLHVTAQEVLATEFHTLD